LVSETLVNNFKNVLFRCNSCHLAYHFEHLSARSELWKIHDDIDDLREARRKQYSANWQCPDCLEDSAKIQALVAWRPADHGTYIEGQTAEELREDQKEYLVRWENKSYFQCSWMFGGWVWGRTAVMMRTAFLRRDEGANLLPKWTNEEAIPEEYLRMEIIFEVRYDAGFRSKSEKIDRAAINRITEVLVKFRGLGYEDTVWEEPPPPKDEERWSDFVAAYNEWLAGKYFHQSSPNSMQGRVDEFRSSNFEQDVELLKQPSALTGGEIMKYQLDGMNWLLYNFHQEKNVILADEMGLGKTIQIIALLATLVEINPKCWPFLIVTPNSTCPNWRREIKKWAPSVRVVAYYGAKKARDMAMKYELYPNGSKDLRAHIVVTSYEASVDDHSRSFFRRVKWAGMIIDEGQRLKNDENLLYGALQALKVPYQVLLTG
jgi:chromodomain-helicase-DNA-binding protein 4